MGSLLFAFVGFVDNFILMVALVTGVMACLTPIESGIQVFMLSLWGTHSMPFIQFALIMMGLGSMCAPMMIRPFLPASRDSSVAFNVSSVNTSNSDAMTAGPGASLYIPYCFASSLLALNSLLMLIVWIRYPTTTDHPSRQNDAMSDKTDAELIETRRLEPKSGIWKAAASGLQMLFAHIYFGLEVALGNYLVTYVYQTGIASERDGATLTTIFWGTFTFMKLASIPVITRIGVTKYMMLGLGITLIGNAILVTFGSHDFNLLTIAIIVIATGQSSLYACTFRYLDQYFTISGRVASLTGTALVLGELTFPAIISSLMERHPQVLTWVTLGCSFSLTLVFSAMVLVCNLKLSPEAIATRINYQQLK